MERSKQPTATARLFFQSGNYGHRRPYRRGTALLSDTGYAMVDGELDDPDNDVLEQIKGLVDIDE